MKLSELHDFIVLVVTLRGGKAEVGELIEAVSRTIATDPGEVSKGVGDLIQQDVFRYGHDAIVRLRELKAPVFPRG